MTNKTSSMRLSEDTKHMLRILAAFENTSQEEIIVQSLQAFIQSRLLAYETELEEELDGEELVSAELSIEEGVSRLFQALALAASTSKTRADFKELSIAERLKAKASAKALSPSHA